MRHAACRLLGLPERSCATWDTQRRCTPLQAQQRGSAAGRRGPPGGRGLRRRRSLAAARFRSSGVQVGPHRCERRLGGPDDGRDRALRTARGECHVPLRDATHRQQEPAASAASCGAPAKEGLTLTRRAQ